MPRPSSPLAGLRILIVEDEFMVAIHIEMLLEDCGCEVAGIATTVQEALVFVGVGQLDGVLLDGNLNGDSSAPVARELLARSIPFVLATGYGGLAMPDQCLNGVPRLAKPFATDMFEKTLRQAFLP